MKVALAALKSVNNDIEYNLRQIADGCAHASNEEAKLVVFGEAFLQGFDALSWDFEKDKNIAVSQDGPQINYVRFLSNKYDIDILIGYYELDGDVIYSSACLISKGTILHNYRRISKGWKEPGVDETHYKEGAGSEIFVYDDLKCRIALCGDLWDEPKSFKKSHIVFWPMYVNYSIAEWRENLVDYCFQAHKVSKNVLAVNSFSDEPAAYGGAFYFHNGVMREFLDFGREGILYVDLF